METAHANISKLIQFLGQVKKQLQIMKETKYEKTYCGQKGLRELINWDSPDFFMED
jgi:hypothetical protein